MKNTYQIRKYLAAAVSLALCAGLLIGCSRSDSSSQDSSAGTGNTGVNASGNVVAGAGSTSSDSTGSSEAAQGQPQTTAATQPDTASAGTSQNAQSVSGTTTQTPQTDAAAPAAGTASGTQNAQTPPVSDVDDMDDEESDGTEEFTGKFVKHDDTEKVQITLENDNKISFVFRNSMINGTAAVDGNIALYHGDDDYTITFDIAGDVLTVTVDGEDAGQSIMNGIYYRDFGEDDTEDDIEDVDVFDGDETEDYPDGEIDTE